MNDNLKELGAILLTNTVHNAHFWLGGLVPENHEVLREFANSLMAIDHVVYVIITASDGRILEQQSKWRRPSSNGSTDTPEQRIYPDEQIAKALLGTPVESFQMTPLVISSDHTLVRPGPASELLLPFFVWHEAILDFAIPVLRPRDTSSPLPHFSIEQEERVSASSAPKALSTLGALQIGITDAEAKRTLLVIIRNVLILAVLLIGAGIFGAHVLTMRITTPLRSLAGAARQLAEGTESPVPLAAPTTDEVGQLTILFNEMTRSLHERNEAITANLETIKRQVSQLTTLHQSSAAIASTLNMNQLLNSVLQLLVENLGFSRMVLILRHTEGGVAYVAQITGVSPVIAQAARDLQIPIKDDGSITADRRFHADARADGDRVHPLRCCHDCGGSRRPAPVPLTDRPSALPNAAPSHRPAAPH